MQLPALWWMPLGRVPEINSHKLRDWLDHSRPVQLVDARSRLEYEAGCLDGAQLASLTDMPAGLEKLDLDPEIPVVVLCLTGHRSRPGTRWLRGRGFEAYSLRGGVAAWKRAGYPLTRPSADSNLEQKI